MNGCLENKCKKLQSYKINEIVKLRWYCMRYFMNAQVVSRCHKKPHFWMINSEKSRNW